jgi:hypothetical protein
MKTQNLDLMLLQYHQSQKELVANEWFSTVDVLFSRYVISFVERLPEEKVDGVYIISDKAVDKLFKYRGYIAFYLNGWRFLLPKTGFIFFVESSSDYFIFLNGAWQRHCYNIRKITNVSGDIVLDIACHSNFEIDASSDIRIGIVCNASYSKRVEIKITYDNPVVIDWCKNIVFTNGLVFPSINIKGGISVFGYYSSKYDRFIVDQVSCYQI